MKQLFVFGMAMLTAATASLAVVTENGQSGDLHKNKYAEVTSKEMARAHSRTVSADNSTNAPDIISVGAATSVSHTNSLRYKENVMKKAFMILFQKITYDAIWAEGNNEVDGDAITCKCSLTTCLMPVAFYLKRVLVRKNCKCRVSSCEKFLETHSNASTLHWNC